MLYRTFTFEFSSIHNNKSYDECPAELHIHKVKMAVEFVATNPYENSAIDVKDFMKGILDNTTELPDYWTLEDTAQNVYDLLYERFSNLVSVKVWTDEINDLQVTCK